MRDKTTRADGAAIPYHLWNDIGGLQEPKANQEKGWQSWSIRGVYKTKIKLQRSFGQAEVKPGAAHSSNSSLNISEEISEEMFLEMVR
jgi:hypothetical protein